MKKIGMFVLCVFLIACQKELVTPATPTPEQGCDVFEECGDEGVATTNSFVEEYEILNGTTNSSGKEHRTIHIPEDHPFEKISQEVLLEKLTNKETFYLYVGDSMCPWCRSVLETAISKAKEYKVDKIYYIEIWDEEGNEIFRDKFIEDCEKAIREVEPTEAYLKLLEVCDPLLQEYFISGEETECLYETGEKRIYAPSFFYIENGIGVKMTTGIPSDQEDPRADLTDAQAQEQKEQFDEFFK